MGAIKNQHVIESSERYQAFLRNSQEGIWRFELDEPISVKLPVKKQIKLMYKYAWLAEANLAMAKMYGFRSVKPLIGLRLGDLLVEDDPTNIEYLSTFIGSNYKLSNVESHEKDRHGRDRYFRNSLVGIIEDGKIIRAWGTQQDVTDQHMADLAMKKSEARLQLALKASKVGIWEWDVETRELTWSDELKAIFGLKPNDKITYDKYIKLLHPEDRDRTQQIISKGMETGSSYQIEHRTIWPDGSEHWILGQGQALKKNGKPILMIGTSMLIDDRKKYEEQLIDSEQRFREMADTAPVLIWISDTENKGTYFNRVWLEFTGRTLEQELGFGWAEAVHPEDLERATTYCGECFMARKEFKMEFRLKRADGQYRWVLDHGIPRYTTDGKFLGYIGSCVDIEDFKTALRRSTELELSNAQLIELNDAKDEFISIASHQLRTPATGVKQYVGMVLEGFAGTINRDQAEMLKLAYLSNERQIKIINDLLRVAQVDAGKIELRRKKSDIIAIIEDVIEEQRTKFKDREQTISFSIPAGTSINISVDSGLMRMVLENLIDNAGKYSPEKSKVHVKVKNHDDELTVSVKDYGVGIDSKDQEKLFQKFHRIQNHLTDGIEGNGLGLYWSKSIVDLHGGTINVKSKPNLGSTFTIHLPLQKETTRKSKTRLLKKQG